MADFRLSDEQRQYQNLAREFAANEIAPKAAHFDDSGEFPTDIYRQAWELGLINVHIPEAYGGFGLSLFDGCVIAEEIGAACTGIGAAVLANSLAQAPLISWGSDEQKKQFLGPFADQCAFAAFCVADEMEAKLPTAKKVAEEYVLDGECPMVTNAGVATWFIVLAVIDDGRDDNEFSAFLVPREASGVLIGDRGYALGQKAADRRAVTFRQTRIAAGHRLGKEGQGSAIAQAALSYWRTLAASAAAGLSRSCLEHSLRYSQERTTFGQPIANYQGVSFMLADMAKDIEAARLLAWQAAQLVDLGAASPQKAAIAWTFAVDVAMRIATDAVQIFGGYGYTREYPVEKLMRDAKVMQLAAGTSQRQRVAIGRALAG